MSDQTYFRPLETPVVFNRKHQEDFAKSLAKSYEPGYATDPAGFDGTGVHGNINVLGYESLQQELVFATEDREMSVLYRKMPKSTTNQLNNWFNVLTDLPNASRIGWDGNIAPASFSSMRREYEQVKLYETRYDLNEFVISGIVGQRPPAKATEDKTHAISLVKTINNDMYWNTVIPNGVEGIFNRVENDSEAAGTNVIDLKGAPLDIETLSSASKVLTNQWAGGNFDLFLSPDASDNFMKNLVKTKAYHVGSPGVVSQIGLTLPMAIPTPHGSIALNHEIYLRKEKVRQLGSAGPPVTGQEQAPDTPGLSTAFSASGSGTDFQTADADSYHYYVTAVNGSGESGYLHVTSAAALAIAAGEQASGAVIDTSPANRKATGFYVYRCTDGEYDAQPTGYEKDAAVKIFEVSNLDTSGQPKTAAVTITDTNQARHDSTNALLLPDMSSGSFGQQVGEIKYMGPGMMAKDLPQQGHMVPRIMTCLLASMWKNRRKVFVIKNIGSTGL